MHRFCLGAIASLAIALVGCAAQESARYCYPNVYVNPCQPRCCPPCCCSSYPCGIPGNPIGIPGNPIGIPGNPIPPN